MLKEIIIALLILIIIVILFLFYFLHYHINLKHYISLHQIKPHDLFSIDYTNKKRVNLPMKAVISLKTIPTRIDDLYYTIYSLLDQSVRVDEIIINIPYLSSKGIEYKIPLWLKKLNKKYQFIILNRCEDEGPITKLTPTIRKYNEETAIFVFDDDTIYKYNIVESLGNLSKKYPNCAITSTGYRFFNKNKTPRSYKSFAESNVKHVDILMGNNGYLVYNTFFKDDWEAHYKDKDFFSIDDNCISLYLNKHAISIYSYSHFKGFSLMKWDYFFKLLLNYNSDALSRNSNKAISSTKFFGKYENKILKKYGFYLTNYSYMSWLIN